MFKLKIVKGAEQAEGVQLEVQLPEPLARFTVGRDPANRWPIPDRTRAISAHHCEFVADGGRVLLRDLSTNGTFVNGSATRLAGDHVLRDGDCVELGPYVIEVRGHGPHGGAVRASDTVVAVLPVPPPPSPSPSPASDGSAAQRGGDPAAMLATGVRAPREGLTEFLRAASPIDDTPVSVTKIRQAPKGHRTPAPAPPAPPAAPAADPVLAALAQGLQLQAASFAGRSPTEAAAQVALLARAAVTALRQLAPAHDALCAAPTPQAALQALLVLGAGAEALLQNTAKQVDAARQAPR